MSVRTFAINSADNGAFGAQLKKITPIAVSMVILRFNSAKLSEMSQIKENLDRIHKMLGSAAKLVVVSKYRNITEIQEVYDNGQRIFAENRVQALLERYGNLPKDIQWHLIGHLQTNKVKYIAPFISLIHSVDSFKLLSEINQQAQKSNRNIDCLLQIYVASEETKFGLEESELFQLLKNEEWQELANIRIVGLMAMATNTLDTDLVSAEFKHAKNIFDSVKKTYFNSFDYFKELSIGMSSDAEIALKNGSTMVRIGTAVFE